MLYLNGIIFVFSASFRISETWNLSKMEEQ